MDTTFVAREQSRLLGELSEFLSHPECERPARARRRLPARGRMAARRARPASAARRSSSSRATAIRWSGRRARTCPAGPTLLIYGHYDVQPPDPLDEWISPPFEPTVRDGRLYARGAADDKGQVFCLLKAYEATLDAERRPPLNVRFIFEGEEECGGHVISDLLRRRARAHPGRCGAGVRHVVLRARMARGLHGAAGPLLRRDLGPHARSATCTPAPTAASRPTRSRRWSASWPSSRTPTARSRFPSSTRRSSRPPRRSSRAWKQLPFDKEAFLREEVTGQALTGLKEYSVFERVWALPTFEIHGIKGGFVGEGAKTVIPAQATAKVSLRLVPGQRYDKVGRAARARGGDAGAPVGRRAGQAAPRRRSGAGGREPSRVRGAGRGVRGGHRAAPRCGCGPAGRSPSCPSSASPARRCCSPASACPTTGCTPPTKNSTSLSSGAGSRSSGGSSSCSPRRAQAARRGYALLLRRHPLDRPGVARLGAGVQLVHADERARRGDDARHDVVGPVRIGPLARGQPRGAALEVADRGGDPLGLRRRDHGPGAGRAELHFLERLQMLVQPLGHRASSAADRPRWSSTVRRSLSCGSGSGAR